MRRHLLLRPRSTNPELLLQRAQNWRDRIDGFQHERLDCVLIFKVEPRARTFEPNARWQ